MAFHIFRWKQVFQLAEDWSVFDHFKLRDLLRIASILSGKMRFCVHVGPLYQCPVNYEFCRPIFFQSQLLCKTENKESGSIAVAKFGLWFMIETFNHEKRWFNNNNNRYAYFRKCCFDIFCEWGSSILHTVYQLVSIHLVQKSDLLLWTVRPRTKLFHVDCPQLNFQE